MSFAARIGVLLGLIVDPPGIPNVGDVSEGGVATITLTIRSDGTWDAVGANEGTVATGTWLNPTFEGAGSIYWIRATHTGGTAPSGTLGSWLQLGGDRVWLMSRGFTIGATSGGILLEWATDAAGANIVTSDGVTLTATVVPA